MRLEQVFAPVIHHRLQGDALLPERRLEPEGALWMRAYSMRQLAPSATTLL